MKRIVVLPLMLATTFALAQSGGMQGMDMKDPKAAEKADKKAAAKPHQAVGVVKSVDAKKGTVTLAHEPVASLNWPAMTMTFKAQDPRLLEGVAVGKKVEIEFVERGREHVITKVK